MLVASCQNQMIFKAASKEKFHFKSLPKRVAGINKETIAFLG